MSNYPYRLPPSDTDRRAPPGPYGSSEHRHTSPQQEFYRPPQETSSSRVPWSQDGALNLLSSCGLEPSDLALLAELPEDVLTVESLPHVLKQIKGKRGTVKPPLPTAPPPSSSSVFPHSSAPAHRPTANLSANNWSHHSSQPVLYPLDKTSSTPLSLDSNRWGSPMTSSSVGLDPPLSSSSSSRYMVDYQHQLGPSEFSRTSRVSGAASSVDYQHRPGPSDLSRTSRDHGTASSVDYQHRPGPSEFGKMGRDAAVAAGSSVGPGKRSRPSRFSQVDPADYRLAPPPEVHQPETRAVHPHAANSSSQPEAIAPSKKEAQDFHGTCPLAFPYSCSLCDITVMSEKVWSKHVNGTGHADGQLGLLQRFPAWDCRLDSVGLRADSQSETKKDAGTPVQPPQAAKHNTNQQQSQKPQKKTSDSSKVVCVKFPPQSVDEAYLRKLTEPFGKIVKILMFPSLAFVELGSVDQAKDLVKFHINFPPTVNGQQMEFSISKTFSFLQSSRVVSLTPCPSGQNGRSDLISIVKRFGSPLYTLFLPSKAYVEMKDGHEAQKLVDYYASTTLRINGDIIKVSYSGEYKSLMRVTSAQKYDQESDQTETKRTGSRSSPDKSRSRERSTRDRKTRSSSRSRSTRDKKTRSRSRSRDRKTRSSSRSRSRDRKSRSRSGSRSRGRKTRSKSRSRQRSTKHRKTKSRSRSKEKSKEEPRSPSGSKEKSASEKRPRSRSGSKEKSWGPETSGSRTDAAPDTSKHEDKEEQQSEGEALSSADDSDIEGMEVIGEDLENLDEEDLETMAEVIDTDEEEEDEEMDEETRGDGKEKKMEEEEEEDEEEEQEEVQFPLDLENCITLDELDEQTQAESPQDPSDSSGDDRDEDEPSSWSTRVVSFRRLPIGSFTDTEFIRLVRDFGTPLTYFIRPPGCGFIEMSSASEARNAADGLSRKPVFKGSRILVELSYRYRRLSSGWKIPKDQDLSESRTRSSSRRRSERLSKDESNRISQGKKESRSRKTPDKESRSSKSPDKESRKTPDKESRSSNSPEKESRSGKTPEKESRSSNSPEKESRSGKTPEKEFRSSKSPDKESRKTPEKESRSRKTPEKESRSRKTPEKESRSSKSPDKESRKTPDKESRSSKSPEKESRSGKTPEKEPRSSNSPEKEPRSGKTPEKESRSSKSPDKESRKTPEKESRSNKSPEKESGPDKSPEKEQENRNRKTPNKGSRSRKTPKKEPGTETSPEKESWSTKSPERESGSEKSQEIDSVSSKTSSAKESTEQDSVTRAPSLSRMSPDQQTGEPTLKTSRTRTAEPDLESVPTEERVDSEDNRTLKRKQTENSSALEKRRKGCGEERDHEAAAEEASGPEPSREDPEPQDPEPAGGLQDHQVDPQPGPAGATADPSRPVGTEFVRPVVGYFCNLCQLIYADEDEAKQQHCSSLAHYIKYQEKTGRDPWTS